VHHVGIFSMVNVEIILINNKLPLVASSWSHTYLFTQTVPRVV